MTNERRHKVNRGVEETPASMQRKKRIQRRKRLYMVQQTVYGNAEKNRTPTCTGRLLFFCFIFLGVDDEKQLVSPLRHAPLLQRLDKVASILVANRMLAEGAVAHQPSHAAQAARRLVLSWRAPKHDDAQCCRGFEAGESGVQAFPQLRIRQGAADAVQLPHLRWVGLRADEELHVERIPSRLRVPSRFFRLHRCPATRLMSAMTAQKPLNRHYTSTIILTVLHFPRVHRDRPLSSLWRHQPEAVSIDSAPHERRGLQRHSELCCRHGATSLAPRLHQPHRPWQPVLVGLQRELHDPPHKPPIKVHLGDDGGRCRALRLSQLDLVDAKRMHSEHEDVLSPGRQCRKCRPPRGIDVRVVVEVDVGNDLVDGQAACIGRDGEDVSHGCSGHAPGMRPGGVKLEQDLEAFAGAVRAISGDLDVHAAITACDWGLNGRAGDGHRARFRWYVFSVMVAGGDGPTRVGDSGEPKFWGWWSSAGWVRAMWGCIPNLTGEAGSWQPSCSLDHGLGIEQQTA
ncbi:hypothetical protein DFH27DRAFT_529231 [Peziza echinospora]|nr:hypothetical protein DFH27DRAFT_529231 [Peziza echinospora]